MKDFITHKKDDQEAEAFLFPMPAWHLYNKFENGIQVDSANLKQLRMLSTIAWMFFAAGITVMLIAVLTVSFQAIRAALANLVKALQSE